MNMNLFSAMLIFLTIIQFVQCGTTFYFEENSWKTKPYHESLSQWVQMDEDQMLPKDHPFQTRAISVFTNIVNANTNEMKQNNWTISVEKQISYKPGKTYEEDYPIAYANPKDGFISIIVNDVYFFGKNKDE